MTEPARKPVSDQEDSSRLVVRLNRDETVADINAAGCRLLGFSRQEVLGKKWFDNFVPPQIARDIRPFFQQIVRGASPPESYESPVLTRDGQQRVMRWRATVLRDAKGRMTGIETAGEDVTERARAEEALRRSQIELQTILDSLDEGVAVSDMSGNFRYWNRAAIEMHGYSRPEEVQKALPEFTGTFELRTMSGEVMPVERWPLSRVIHDGSLQHLEVDIRRKDRDWRRIYEYSGKSARDAAGEAFMAVVTVRDVTRRRQLEEELEQYRNRLETVVAERTAQFAQAHSQLEQKVQEYKKAEAGLSLRATILDNAREAIFMLNGNGDFTYSNEAASQTYGYTREEFLTMNLRQLLPPEQALVITARLKEVFRTGRLEVEAVHHRKDGSALMVRVRHNLVRTQHGQFVVSVMRDITDYRLEEERLKASLAAKETLIEHLPGIVLTTDLRLKLTGVSGAGLSATGMKRGEAEGMSLDEFLKKSGFPEDVVGAARRALEGETHTYVTPAPGRPEQYSASTSPLHDKSGAICGTVTALLPRT